MNERCHHALAVLGDSPAAVLLRRRLQSSDAAGVIWDSSIGAIRRRLVAGEFSLVIVAVVLDDIAVSPFAESVRTLLADRAGFASSVRSVGVLGAGGWNAAALAIGCDVVVNDSDEALDAVALLRDAWTASVGRRRSGATGAAPGWMPVVESMPQPVHRPSRITGSAPSPSRRAETRAGDFGEASAPP